MRTLTEKQAIVRRDSGKPTIWASHFRADTVDRDRFALMYRTDLEDEWTETKLANGESILLRRANCGLGCRCAAQWKPVPDPY